MSLLKHEGLQYSFQSHQKDFSIVEGVMGLYDGIDHSLDANPATFPVLNASAISFSETILPLAVFTT